MAGTQSTPPQSPQQGETPSPLCNHLLEQVRLRVEGTLPAEDLRMSAQEAIKSLEQAREQTLATLENNGAKDEVLDAFERSFEEMQVALEEIDEYADRADQASHEAVRGAIFRAAHASTLAVLAMQQAELSDGPTDMPLYNGLFKMKEGYLQDKVEGSQLQDALDNIVKMTKAAIAELLAAEGEQPPQRDGLVRAYEEQIESLERVGETIDGGSKDKISVDDAFESLLKTSLGVREAMASLNEAMMSVGPCRLARANVLLSASESFRAGGIGPEQFGRTLDSIEGELREERAAVDEMAGLPGQSEFVIKEVEGVRAAYDMHDEAIAIFSEIIEGDAAPEDFAKAQKLLIEASEKLSDHKEELERIGESEGKVSCVRCGASNEVGQRVCVKCGAQLPQQAGAGAVSTMSYQESDGAADFGDQELEMTTNLEILFQAVNEVAESRRSDDEFEEVIDWMDGLLEEAARTMPDVPAMQYPDCPPDMQAKIEELQVQLSTQRASMMEGIEGVREALGVLGGYVESHDKNVLVEGVRGVRDGVIRMQAAEKALIAISETLQKATAEAQASRGEDEGESGSDFEGEDTGVV